MANALVTDISKSPIGFYYWSTCRAGCRDARGSCGAKTAKRSGTRHVHVVGVGGRLGRWFQG